MQLNYATLEKAVEVRGVGLHCGAMIRARLLPRDELGIVVTRSDLPGAPSIPVALKCVTNTMHATTLEHDGASVATTEHLLAALWTRGITHCEIELDGPEVPILDGSARDWCRLLQEAGSCEPNALEPNESIPNAADELRAPNEPQASNAIGASKLDGISNGDKSRSDESNIHSPRLRPLWKLREPVWVAQGDVFVIGLPLDHLRVSVAVEYAPRYVGKQSFDAVVSWDDFARDIAPARTFTLQEWIEPLRAQGLIQGGSVDNAVVLGLDAPSSPWRFDDEVARHKALDVLGDIALLFGGDGGRLQAHLIASRAGHGAHRLWMEECLRRNALVRADG